MFEFSPALSNLTEDEDDEQKAALRTLIRTVWDARQITVVDRLLRLETEDPVQLEVPEDLLARLERFETAFRSTMLSNQPTIEAFNTFRVDVNKIL